MTDDTAKKNYEACIARQEVRQTPHTMKEHTLRGIRDKLWEERHRKGTLLGQGRFNMASVLSSGQVFLQGLWSCICIYSYT